MRIEDEDILNDFIQESKEHLANIENELLLIEEHGADIDVDLVNKVFRKIHSIKGAAGFIGLSKIQALAHALENLLNLVRNKEYVPGPASMDVMLAAADQLARMISNTSESEHEDIEENVQKLKGLLESGLSEEVKEELDTKVPVRMEGQGQAQEILLGFEMSKYDLEGYRKKAYQLYVVTIDLIVDCESRNKTPLQLIRACDAMGEIVDSYVSIDEIGTLDQIESGLMGRFPLMCLLATSQDRDFVSAALEVPITQVQRAMPDAADQTLSAEADPASLITSEMSKGEPPSFKKQTKDQTMSPTIDTNKKESSEVKKKSVADATIRVNIKLLDTLMNLAGELVLGRNQMMQIVNQREDPMLTVIGQKISAVTTDLQSSIMMTRMQAVGDVFNKYPRLVRDLAKRLDKTVQLSIEGHEVELDKTVIEAIGDPLTHIVRNSVDHGIESPSERKARGKNPEGQLLLKAFHQGGLVNIVIQDDGKGIDPEEIKEKALEKGLISLDTAEHLRKEEILNFIFHPGLSTAKVISDVSGRGVGMDVVKTNIVEIGGTVEIQSEVNKGTTICVKLPLTLAIIHSLVVRSGKERFAIPQVNVVELVRVKASEVAEKIEKVKNAEVLRLRGTLLPLVRLSHVLGERGGFREAKTNDSVNVERKESVLDAHEIVVLAAGDFEYGLIVDAVLDFEEIVVKPLGRHLSDCCCYAGATIMGDGQVALILDVAGLTEYAKLRAVKTSDDEEEQKVAAERHEHVPFVFFNNGGEEQFAVPLSLVSRLDKVKPGDIVAIGGKQTMPYFDETLTLIELDKFINVAGINAAELSKLYVIALAIPGCYMGILAKEIKDIRQIVPDLDMTTFKRKGVVGSAILEGDTTLFLDAHGLVSLVDPHWKAEASAQIHKSNGDTPTILLAEDSDFFRTQVKNFLCDEGYHVLDYADGQHAFEGLIEHLQEVDLVMTDIEMPVMDGYEFTRQIKGDDRTKHLKVFSLTSLAGDENMAKGAAAGIDEYMVKLDKELLLSNVRRCLRQTATA